MKRKYILRAFILCFFAGVLIISCEKPEKKAPSKPLTKSIELDLSFFQQDEGGSFYKYAFSQVNYWQILLNDSLKFQKALLTEAVNKDPIYQSDNIWTVSANLEYNDLSYDVDLFITDYTDSLQNKLYFSLFYPQDTFTYLNLLTLNGMSYKENLSGYWIINKPDTSNTYKKFLEVNWGDTLWNESKIKFTNSLSGNDNGNYILYIDSLDDNFNSYLDLFEKESENHTYIQWNSSTNAGRIKDNLHFNDANWYYWDESLEDISD